MANAQVTGFPNNCHQSFPTRDEAEAAYLEFSGGDAVPLLDNAPPQAQHGVVNHSPCLVYVCIVLLCWPASVSSVANYLVGRGACDDYCRSP
jgi:hypothetical protein